VVPPGVNPTEVIRSFELEVRKLERCEVLMNVKGEVVRCCGGIGCICGDMPQSNLFAGVKGVGAYKCCRKCGVHKTEFMSYECEFEHKRTKANQAAIRSEINNAETKIGAEALETHYGVNTTKASYFSDVILCKQRQLPHDPFHCDIIGNSAALLAIFLQCLTAKARTELAERLANWKPPPNWSAIPGFVLASSMLKVKMGGQKVKELIIVLHLVCAEWLETSHFNHTRRSALQERFGDQFLEKVLETLALQSASNYMVFGESHRSSTSNGNELTLLLRRTRALVVAVWHEIGDMNMNKPNQHVGTEHHGEVHEDFGGCINTTCAHFECKHGALRRSAHNNKNLEVAMITHENVYNAILLLGVSKTQADICCDDGVGDWIREDPTFQKVLSQWTSVMTYAGTSENDNSLPEGVIKTGHWLANSVLSVNTFVASMVTVNSRFGCDVDEYIRSICNHCVSYVVQLFSYFEFCDRQFYQRKVKVSEFYECDDGMILQVSDCLVFDIDDSKHYWSRVQEFRKTTSKVWRMYPVLEPAGPLFYVPTKVMSRPLYVLHRCDDNCRVKIGIKGLEGSHNAQNHQYILHPFFVK